MTARAQRVERACSARFRRRRFAVVEPQDAIAADVGAHDARRRVPDPRRREVAAGVAPQRFVAQRRDRAVRQEIADDRDAASRERVDGRIDRGRVRLAAAAGADRAARHASVTSRVASICIIPNMLPSVSLA